VSTTTPTPTFTFDRDGAKVFRAALDSHLAALSKELGITVKSGRMTFDPVRKEITTKVEATAGEETARAKFAALATLYGLDASDFGRSIKGDTINGITNTGRLTVARGAETRLYPVKALPSLVAMLHPGEPSRMATARIATGKALPNDYKVAYGERLGLTEVPAPNLVMTPTADGGAKVTVAPLLCTTVGSRVPHEGPQLVRRAWFDCGCDDFICTAHAVNSLKREAIPGTPNRCSSADCVVPNVLRLAK
jgi:hypothetical protein